MENPTQNFKEKKKQFDRKIFIVNELKRVTQDFNQAFPALRSYYEQESKMMLKVQEFTKKFYNKDCIYKAYTQQYSNASEKEVENLNTIANSFKNIGNFSHLFLKSFEKFEKQKKLVMKRLEKEQHYVKKVCDLENKKEKNEIMNKINTKKQLNKIERNKRKKQVAEKETNFQMEEFNESFLNSVKERFQIINPFLKDFIIKKQQFYQRMNEVYTDVLQNISILEMEDNFEEYKDNLFQSRLENMSKISGIMSNRSINDSVNFQRSNLRSQTMVQQIQPQINLQQFNTNPGFNFQKKISPSNTLQNNNLIKEQTQQIESVNQNVKQIQNQDNYQANINQNSQQNQNFSNQNFGFDNQNGQQNINNQSPPQSFNSQNQQQQFQVKNTNSNNQFEPFENFQQQTPNFNNEPFEQNSQFNQPVNNQANLNDQNFNNYQPEDNTQDNHFNEKENNYDEFGNPIYKGRSQINQFDKIKLIIDQNVKQNSRDLKHKELFDTNIKTQLRRKLFINIKNHNRQHGKQKTFKPLYRCDKINNKRKSISQIKILCTSFIKRYFIAKIHKYSQLFCNEVIKLLIADNKIRKVQKSSQK